MAEQDSQGTSPTRRQVQPARRTQRMQTRDQAQLRAAQQQAARSSQQQTAQQAARSSQASAAQQQTTQRQTASAQGRPATAQTQRTRAAAQTQRAGAARSGQQPARKQQQRPARASASARGSILDALPSWLVPGILGVAALGLLIGLVMLIGGCVRSCSPEEEAEEIAAEAAPFERSVQLIPATSGGETAEGDGDSDGDEAGTSSPKPAYLLYDEGRVTSTGEGRVSFSAVGDNLINANLLELVASWSPAAEDGSATYDFHPLYEHVKPYIQDGYDISFINQETVMGGTDYFGYTGYPSYNTPETMAEAIYDTGWRVVNNNSNHTYDIWVAAIEHQQQMWRDEYPTVATIGSYESEEDYQTPRVVECNGVRIAFLSYSYGQNGYELSDLPNYYYSTWWDEDRMRADVARAREVADAVVVYLHTGIEYTNTPSPDQVTWSYACAEANVDLVIGSHVHWIQPIEWLDRADGGKMLVVHGLGDFVSGYHDNPECIMSGMFSCDFVKVEPTSPTDAPDEDDGQAQAADAGEEEDGGQAEPEQHYPTGIKLENLVWHPVIEHWENGSDAVYLVRDYTAEQAASNELLWGLADPYQWIVNTTENVIGDVVEIDWGTAAQADSSEDAG